MAYYYPEGYHWEAEEESERAWKEALKREKEIEERCSDCPYLVEGDNGEWLCENCEFEEDIKNVFDIPFCEAVE